MEAEELDTALEELEIRLERLRALYEQYFLGIEKLEPQIPRKDVDRRIHLLRREKIRNTGKRFKLQTLIQRYNTFQQYWQRICREIENGTYKRHIARAEKNIGPTELLTVAARRRFGKERDRREPEAARAASSLPPAASATASSPPPSAPPARASLPAASQPSSLPPDSDGAVTRPPGPRRTPTLRGISTPPPPGAEVPISLRPVPPPMTPAPAPAPPKRPSTRPHFESLELDMDFMGDWDPQAASPPRRAPGAAKAPPAPTKLERPPARAAQDPERRVQAQQAISELERAAAREASEVARAASEAAAAQRRLAPPPKPAAKPVTAEQELQVKAVPPPTATAAPAIQGPPRTEGGAGESELAPKARPERAESPARTKPAKHAAKGPAPTLSEQRLKEVHERLLEAHKSTGQASSPSYDGLAKSLRAVEAKLRAQHGSNRKVDFEIVVKDGKPVVKPIVR